MADKGLPVDKLRDFLRELAPGARSLLLAELERAALRGDQMPGADLILAELRAGLRTAETPLSPAPKRIGDPSRLFFKPLEPFLVDDVPERKHRGRIARASLGPIWTWLTRNLMPEEAKAFDEAASRALVTGDSAGADGLAKAFQDRAVQRIQAALSAVAGDDKARRRLAVQIGTPLALDDLGELLGVLKARDALVLLSQRLPISIKNLADEQLDNVKALLDTPIARHSDVFLYALLLTMSRLGQPWQLLRLATKAADSDHAARVAETPYGVAVAIVLTEIERLLDLLRQSLKGTDAAVTADALKDIHDAARALRTEINLSVDTPWSRQLSTIRSSVSELIRERIEGLPGQVRRLLRPRAAKEIVPHVTLDGIDVAEVEAALEFLSVCRTYASELAMNEVTRRVHTEIEQYLDTGTSALLDGLRNAGDGDRAFRQSQVDAAVRFAAKIFGQSYASLLAKAADVAGQGERKQAKG